MGLAYVQGLDEVSATKVALEREQLGLFDLVQRSGLPRRPVENLIRVGALDSLGRERRDLLWQLGLPSGAGQLGGRQLGLATDQDQVTLAELSAYERMATDYEVLKLSPDSHPMRFLRASLASEVLRVGELRDRTRGQQVETAGLVVCRQRPSTASGVVFLLLEDESGLVNVAGSSVLYDRDREAVRTSSFLRSRSRAGWMAMLARCP